MLFCSLWFLTSIFLPCLCRWNPSHCFAQPWRQVFTSTPHVTTLPLEAQRVVLLLFYLLLLALFFSCSFVVGYFFLSAPMPPNGSFYYPILSHRTLLCWLARRVVVNATQRKEPFSFCCAFPDSERRKEERDNLSHSHCLNLNILGLSRRGQMWGA